MSGRSSPPRRTRSRRWRRASGRWAREPPRAPGRLGAGVPHHPGGPPLPGPAGEEPLDEVGLRLRGPAEQLAEDLLAGGRRPAPRGLPDRVDRAIELLDRHRRLTRGRALDAVDGGIADADPTLPGNARQKADGAPDLARVEAAKQLGEDRDLRGARAGLGDLPRGGDDVGEQGHRTAPAMSSRSPRCLRFPRSSTAIPAMTTWWRSCSPRRTRGSIWWRSRRWPATAHSTAPRTTPGRSAPWPASVTSRSPRARPVRS